MSKKNLEERVAALEKQVDELRSDHLNDSTNKDWRRTIGAFTGDDVMREIFEEGRKIREAERSRARSPKKKQSKAR